jgi:hypothetical protein
MVTSFSEEPLNSTRPTEYMGCIQKYANANRTDVGAIIVVVPNDEHALYASIKRVLLVDAPSKYSFCSRLLASRWWFSSGNKRLAISQNDDLRKYGVLTAEL